VSERASERDVTRYRLRSSDQGSSDDVDQTSAMSAALSRTHKREQKRECGSTHGPSIMHRLRVSRGNSRRRKLLLLMLNARCSDNKQIALGEARSLDACKGRKGSRHCSSALVSHREHAPIMRSLVSSAKGFRLFLPPPLSSPPLSPASKMPRGATRSLNNFLAANYAATTIVVARRASR